MTALLTATCGVQGGEDSAAKSIAAPPPCDTPFLCDPSFERSASPNQFGQVFPEWDGWRYEGDAEFRASNIAHSGKSSCLLFGEGEPKIRIFKSQKSMEPGRYQVTAYIRGLNIGRGKWDQTIEFAFGDKYIQLDKNGTFGWSKLTYVGEVSTPKEIIIPSFGLMAPGYFWIDDVELKKVPNSTPLTEKPVIGKEETPIVCGAATSEFIRCKECGFKNPKLAQACCACGAHMNGSSHALGKPTKLINSFEDLPLWDRVSALNGLSQEEEHVTDGKKSLKITNRYMAAQDGISDWSGFDYLVVDLFALGNTPSEVILEIRDDKTDGYWTRVNYNTSVPAGKSVLKIPLDTLYVGEKSRPGRKLDLKAVTKLVIGVAKECEGVYFDNVRLERDQEIAKYVFDGLFAFDLGTRTSPLMPGFTRMDTTTLYNPGTGFGLKDAQIWRSFDVLQPDPLFQDFICIEKGGIAVDVPNGKYRVFVNMDNPSGYWGEYQVYEERKLIIEGKDVAVDKMDFDSFKQKYYRHWLTEDMPSDNTFDKYQVPYYNEHLVDVDVADGQLNIEFSGSNWACSVSSVVIFPVNKADKGSKFLSWVKQKRRTYFDDEFKRVLHDPTGDAVKTDTQTASVGFVPFVRDYTKDIYSNDRPTSPESATPVVRGAAFQDEKEPLTVAVYALQDIKETTISASDLTGPGTISSSNLSIGYVSNRLTRKAMDGRVYSIEPRLVIPSPTAPMQKNTSRRFWITLHVPKDAKPGDYKGSLTISASNSKSVTVPIEFHVYRGTLDPSDIPVGPWGHSINLPWLASDARTDQWNSDMAKKSLLKLRENGFTTFTGMPVLTYRGFVNGEPDIDFTTGDEQMRMAKSAGFTMPIVSYVGINGLDLYYKDEAAMNAAGYTSYDQFIKKVFSAIEAHAVKNNWLPVYWNIGDEPIDDDLMRSIQNATAYRNAFPKGPPFFTAATSFDSGKSDDPHLTLAKLLHVADFNSHNQKSVEMLRAAGGNWAFYNNGNRWTYGVYLYKAAKQFDMKFRLNWHWNVVAGDPYYALDCREDDYAWANSGPNGELVTSVMFEREMREGLDDYRYLLTLSNLAAQKKDAAAKQLVESILSEFELGDTDKEYDYRQFRTRVAAEIERLRK
jgi:hypothetical protein